MSDFIERWSPNFDERSLPISMIVLHYTGMKTGIEAIDRLADPEAKVSAHYVVGEDGQIIHMVPEEKRAWHAGKSHWRGVSDINSASVGIEIVNPGHEWGYVPFPEPQVASVVRLVHMIKDRHAITRSLGAFKTSMLQDVEAGRAIETDALLAAPRELAQQLGIATPMLDALLGLTRLMDSCRR